MLVQRLELADEIDLSLQENLGLEVVGRYPAPADDSNLALKAAIALKESTGCPHGAQILLNKQIPSQAGLGGGSADAAAVLQGLNALWDTGLSLEQLALIGVRLGADVPLCLYPGLMHAGGIGEILTPIPGGQAFHLLLLKPEQGLATAEVFRLYDSLEPPQPADIPAARDALVKGNISALAAACRNQLQASAMRICPEIQLALDDLYKNGAAFAQMSGSGSAVFGVFSNEISAEAARMALKEKWPVCLATRTIAD